MDGVGLTHLGAQHVLITAAFFGVIAMTYVVTWFVALFHPDAGRRAEAKRLLGGHLLHRRPPPGTWTARDPAEEDDRYSG